MFSNPSPAWLLAMFLLWGCQFIDLNPLDITSCPNEAEEIIGDGDDIRMTFSSTVERHEAEALLRIQGPSGLVECDFLWDGNTVCLSPLTKLQPGRRYTLSFRGEISTTDGRVYNKNILLPFYYLTDADPSLLTASQPPDAQMVGIDHPLVLTFNGGMDRQSVEDAFSIHPATEIRFSWNDDDTQVIVTPEKQWTNLQYYAWRISPEAVNREGIPVPKEYNGSFLVQLDTTHPHLLSAHPARDNGDGTFTAMESLTLDDLVNGDHMVLIFDEKIDFDTLSVRFRIQPSLDGYLLSWSPDRVLYYLREKIPPEQKYTLIIKKGLEDASGNRTTEETEVHFSPDVRSLKIGKITLDHAGGREEIPPADFNQQDPFVIGGLHYYGADPDYVLNVALELSESFAVGDLSRRLSFADTVSLLPVFPPGTATPERVITSWMTDRVIQLQFGSLSTCTPGNPVYYRLRITCGNPGAANAEGSYLLDPVEYTFRGALE